MRFHSVRIRPTGLGNEVLSGRLCRLVGNRDFDLHPRLDGDSSDLLHNVGRGVQIDNALVDAHLEAVPRLGTLATRSHTGRDVKNLRASDGFFVKRNKKSVTPRNYAYLSRQTNGAGHLSLEALVLGGLLEVSANLLKRRDIARRQRNADAVHTGNLLALEAGLFDSCHFNN